MRFDQGVTVSTYRYWPNAVLAPPATLEPKLTCPPVFSSGPLATVDPEKPGQRQLGEENDLPSSNVDACLDEDDREDPDPGPMDTEIDRH